MSKFPIESSDQEGIRDAVNYLLSGPGGLGQDFQGFNSSETAYITGNFRKPYSQTTVAELYVAAITLSKAEMLDSRTFKYTFAAAQPSAPFSLGNGLSISGFTDNIYNTYPPANTDRNENLGQIGVIECTTTYFIVRSIVDTALHAAEFAAGSVFFYSTAPDAYSDPVNLANFVTTDCDVRVNVTGGNERVFVAGQMTLQLDSLTSSATDMAIVVEIDRYFGFTNNDPTNPDYLFNFDRTLAYKIYNFSAGLGSDSTPEYETVFSTIVDNPPPGYYRYFIQIGLASNDPDITVAQFTQGTMGLRSLSAQVVKQ